MIGASGRRLRCTFLAQQRQTLEKSGRARAELALPISSAESNDPYAGAALIDACLGVLNANEFVYID